MKPDNDHIPTEAEVAAAFETLRRHFDAKKRPSAPQFYTSYVLPPDCRRRETFHERVKKLPTARKSGRVWVVPVDDYHAAMSAPRIVTVPRVPDDDAADSPARLLARSGVQTRKGAA